MHIKKTSIITWNINSVRRRIDQLSNMLINFRPDIIMLQEIKCENFMFPNKEIEKLLYAVSVNGQKSYNGTAIISKIAAKEETNVLPNFDDLSSRYQECIIDLNFKKIRFINVYAPQGQDLISPAFAVKMQFYDALYQRLKILLENEESIILVGDYNIAAEAIDVHDPHAMKDKVGFHLFEREKFRNILNLGMFDAFRLIHNRASQFSWWDYRKMSFEKNKGMRIDSILISSDLADCLTECRVLMEFRAIENSSDHAPIFASFEM